jgi:xylulokinase
MPDPASTVLIGVDVGTTNVKAAAYSDQGKLLAVSARRLSVYHPQPGWSEYDPHELIESAGWTIRDVAGRFSPSQIAGVAVSSMAETAVALDSAGLPLRRAIAWHDERTVEQARWWREHVGDEVVYAVCGLPILPIFGINKMMWVRDHEPAIYHQIRRWLNVADYVAYCLCGEQATDFSLASRMMALDLTGRVWSSELCAAAGIDPRLFADLVPSGQRLGVTHAAAREVTGLPVGIPVAAGGMDHPCGAFAVGIREPGDVLDSMGTSESIFTVTTQPLLNATMAASGYQQGIHVDSRFSFCNGGLYTSGAAVEWIKQILAPDDDSYEALMSLATDAPAGSEGAFFLPHLRLPSPPINVPSGRATFVGLSAAHGREHLARAVLEGLAYEARYSLDGLLERMPLNVQRIIAIGGGARNRLLMQIKASVWGRTLEVAEVEEAGAQGAAMLAGVGAGVFSDLSQAVSAMEIRTQPVMPVSDWVVRYEQAYQRVYREMYHAVESLHQAIAGAVREA